MNRHELIQQLKIDEGFEPRPYLDTKGILTVGYGRNLTTGEFTPDEAEHMLVNDIDRICAPLATHPVYLTLNEARRTAIANLTYNIGYRGCLGFKRMWAALAADDYPTAAAELLDSKWRDDVGPNRAGRLHQLILTGDFPT